jgi:hypothetical protein
MARPSSTCAAGAATSCSRSAALPAPATLSRDGPQLLALLEHSAGGPLEDLGQEQCYDGADTAVEQITSEQVRIENGH